jgi:hypothetical protein
MNESFVNELTARIRDLEARQRSEIAGGLQPLVFASLPVAGQPGRMVFVTNGRKVGEGVGAGTGTPAYDDGVAWRRTADDTTVAA